MSCGGADKGGQYHNKAATENAEGLLYQEDSSSQRYTGILLVESHVFMRDLYHVPFVTQQLSLLGFRALISVEAARHVMNAYHLPVIDRWVTIGNCTGPPAALLPTACGPNLEHKLLT